LNVDAKLDLAIRKLQQIAGECSGCDGAGVYSGYVNIDPNDITKGCRLVDGLDCEDCSDIRETIKLCSEIDGGVDDA